MRHLHRRQFIAGRRHHRRRVLPPRQDGGHRETQIHWNWSQMSKPIIYLPVFGGDRRRWTNRISPFAKLARLSTKKISWRMTKTANSRQDVGWSSPVNS